MPPAVGHIHFNAEKPFLTCVSGETGEETDDQGAKEDATELLRHCTRLLGFCECQMRKSTESPMCWTELPSDLRPLGRQRARKASRTCCGRSGRWSFARARAELAVL